ncbi:hypothetical protein T4D_5373 [Trichinella pseudospiralis]|uniref:Uncharacterized protein n=1 Tax=Trichinella pseudospiralis TaxID=6337 RepID=A0A0V1FBG2_TRIPS|nr:hypothetical protein T4D_5373 [Trichinella pseudospiralis]
MLIAVVTESRTCLCKLCFSPNDDKGQLLEVLSVSAICNILLQVQERCWHLYADNCDRRRSNRPLKAASSPLIESQCSICILNLLQNEIGSALADWKLENNLLFLFCLTVLSIRVCHHPTYLDTFFAHIKKSFRLFVKAMSMFERELLSQMTSSFALERIIAIDAHCAVWKITTELTS